MGGDGVVVEAADATKARPNLTSSFRCCHPSLSRMEFFFKNWMMNRNQLEITGNPSRSAFSPPNRHRL